MTGLGRGCESRDGDARASRRLEGHEAGKLHREAAARRHGIHRAPWASQLEQARSIAGWVAACRRAASQCELPHARDRHELLDLIHRRAS